MGTAGTHDKFRAIELVQYVHPARKRRTMVQDIFHHGDFVPQGAELDIPARCIVFSCDIIDVYERFRECGAIHPKDMEVARTRAVRHATWLGELAQ